MAEQLSAALRDDASAGALLLGLLGSGRRTALQEALATLPPTTRRFSVSGTEFASSIPYGALMFLVSGVDPTLLASAQGVLRGMGEVFAASGARPVVVLENTALIDAASCNALAQLAAQGSISLVPICERMEEVPTDIAGLVRSGDMARVEVSPLTPAEAGEVLAADLGSPLSRPASARLWRDGEGNLEGLRLLARDCVASGKLRLAEGHWILAPGTMPLDGHFAARIRVRLAGLGERERLLLDVLAVRGETSVAALNAAGFGPALDGLHAAGHVVRSQRDPGRVEPSNAMVRQVLCAVLDGEQHRLLAAMVQEDPEPFAAARLVAATAREMLDGGNASAAAAFLQERREAGELPESLWHEAPQVCADLLRTEVQALRTAGRSRQAVLMVHTLLARLETGADTADAPAATLEEVRLLAADLAFKAGPLEDGAGPGQSAGDSGPAAGPPFPAHRWPDDGLRIAEQACRAREWALGERQQEAAEAVRLLVRDILSHRAAGVLDEVLPPDRMGIVVDALMTVFLALGEWDTTAQLARALQDEADASPDGAAAAALVLGSLSALGADTGSALLQATPALRQLEAWGPPDQRAALAALTAHCLADQDRPQEAAELLVGLRDGLAVGHPVLAWAVEFFSALTVANLHSAHAACNRLMALADSMAESGRTLLEAHTLAAALRLGEFAAAGRLSGVLGRVQGPLAGELRQLADAVVAEDGQAVETALERIASMGYRMFAEETGNRLYSFLSAGEIRNLTRHLARTEHDRSASGRLPGDATGADPGPDELSAHLAVLTRRERQVASNVVEGLSNAEIAKRGGVSVRTVEGHLYQVYSKLNVRSRTELAQLLSQPATDGVVA
ncbi:helix-turn-helix transcriptional regulator [Arthrobacter ginkgonis]|uniref:helix-turn-helix transcriptional regulator n=1 Tax=Arthrobacter ginkgonis TaxID=1630594 RepID=UPI0031EFE17D